MAVVDGVLLRQHDLRLLAGKKAPDNYWGEGATTLEWTLSSPPPFHQFETLPVIEDHHAHHDRDRHGRNRERRTDRVVREDRTGYGRGMPMSGAPLSQTET